MNPWLLLVLLTLTTHRVTRLITADHLPIVAKPREFIQAWLAVYDAEGNLVGPRRWGVAGESIAYLLSCPWCMSVWVAVGLVFGALGSWSIPLPWLWVAAACSVTGFLSGVVESEHEVRYKRMQAEIDYLRSRT